MKHPRLISLYSFSSMADQNGLQLQSYVSTKTYKDMGKKISQLNNYQTTDINRKISSRIQLRNKQTCNFQHLSAESPIDARERKKRSWPNADGAWGGFSGSGFLLQLGEFVSPFSLSCNCCHLTLNPLLPFLPVRRL